MPNPNPDEIKRWIAEMLRDRAALATSDSGRIAPSRYWLEFCGRFSYVLDLSAESLRQIRIHTYHLTGDNYQSYQLALDGRAFRAARDYDALIRGLPADYIVDEPPDGIGYRFPDGHFLSRDSVRYQRVLRRFHDEGLLRHLGGGESRRRILEIGAGYGGLAHHVIRAAPRAQYVIVDLPETLLFSVIYLTQHYPEARVYLYQASTLERGGVDRFAGYDLVFLPNYALASLQDVEIDLAINLESMQEMTTEQVVQYLELLQANLRGPLYSWNMDRNPKNLQLGSLSGLLARYFEFRELPPGPAGRRARWRMKMKILASKLNLLETPMWENQSVYRELLCMPLARGRVK